MFNGKKVLLENEPGQAVYRHGSTATDLRLKVWTDAQVSNATGALTFTPPANYFTAVNSVSVQIVRNTADPTLAAFAMVRSATATAIAVQVFESKTSNTLLLSITEGLEVATSAIPMFITVFGVGP